jgi:hypothetical protein
MVAGCTTGITHKFTSSFQTLCLSQLPCCLVRSIPMTLYVSLTWASGSWRSKRSSSEKRRIWQHFLCKEDDVSWRRACIEHRWKFPCSVKRWQTLVKSWTPRIIHVSHYYSKGRVRKKFTIFIATPMLALQSLPLNAVGYVGACQEFTLANSNCSPPTRYKCIAWLSSCRKASLLTSSHFHDATEVDSASRIQLPDCPQLLQEHLHGKSTKASTTNATRDPVF